MKGKTGTQGSLAKRVSIANRSLVNAYYAERAAEKRELKKPMQDVYRERARQNGRWSLGQVAHMRWLHESGVPVKDIASVYKMNISYALNLVEYRLNYREIEAKRDPTEWSPIEKQSSR